MSGTIDVPVFGNLSVSGYMNISSAGLFGSVQVGAGSSQTLAGFGFSFSGYVQFEVNTTYAEQDIKRLSINTKTGAVNGLVDGKIAARTVRLTIGGTLNITSFVAIKGSAELNINSTSFDVNFNAQISLGGFGNYSVKGGAKIGSGYLAVWVNLGVNSFDIPGVNVSGTLTLKINTSSTPKTVAGHSISGTTYAVRVSGKVRVWLFELNIGANITYSNNVFRIDFSTTLNFFDAVDISVSGYIESDGDFSISGSVSFDIDLVVIRIDGTLGLTLTNNSFTGYISGGIDVWVLLWYNDVGTATGDMDFL